MTILGYPGLPARWRGESVHRVQFERSVAVIGDIHGRSDLLRRLVARLGSRPIIVVGDVGDRGPDTRGVIDLLVERGALGVMGNHDLWLASWAAGEGFDRLALSPHMGGRATLTSYAVHEADADSSHECVPRAHADWLLGLHVVLDLAVQGVPYWVIHAGIPSDASFDGLRLEEVVPWLARERPTDLLWRANDPDAMVPVGRTIIMGHRPRSEPLDSGDVLAIDTGAGRAQGGRLTAVLLPERQFVTVE